MSEDRRIHRSTLETARQELIIARARVAELEARLSEDEPPPASPLETDDQYHRAFDNLLEGCQIIGFDWRYLYVNDAAARHGHQAQEELLGHTMMERYPGIEVTEMFATLRRGMEERTVQYIENEFVYPDGNKAWFELRIQPVPEGIFVLSLDITERKRAEDEIRSLAKFPSENPNPVLRLRHDGVVLHANEASYWLLEEWGCALGDYAPVFWRDLVAETFSSPSGRIVESQHRDRTWSFFIAPIPHEGYVNFYGRDITDRKRAEEALRESEKRLRQIVESGLVGVIFWNMNGQIVDANDRFLEMVGYSRDELRGGQIDWTNMTPPEYQSLDEHSVVELRATGVNKEPFEKQYIRKDGTRLPIIVAGAMLDEARFNGVAIVLDNTARKQAEEAVRESEERYRLLFEYSLDAIMITAPDGSVQAANPAACRMFEHTEEELRQLGRAGVVDTEDPRLADALAERAREGRFSGELTFLRKDRSRFPGEISSVLYTDRFGESKTSMIIRDVSERKRAEEVLRRYTERLAAINRLDRVISSNLEIDLVYDNFVKELLALVPLDRTSIVLLNESGDQWQTARLWTQHQPVVLLGEWRPVKGSAIDWLVTNHVPLLEPEIGEHKTWPETEDLRREGLRSRLLLPLIIHERVVGALTVGSRQPGTFTEEDQNVLTAVADQLAIAIQNSRLYAQVQCHAAELEQRVSQRTAQLEAANKELEAFSYSVSHDLRAPLRGIDGYARILLRDYAPLVPEDGQRRLQSMRDMAQHMGQLIDDLLTFSRLNRQSFQKQSVDTSKLVREVLEDLMDEMGQRQVEIVLGELPDCRADRSLLKQVFVNLLSNALKFTRPREVSRIEIGTLEDNGILAYFVRDNGVGFDMQYADKLFGVFQRLHRSDEFEGTGVGLAIVQRIINRHGGRVWAEAALDRGASFYFTLEGDNRNDGR